MYKSSIVFSPDLRVIYCRWLIGPPTVCLEECVVSWCNMWELHRSPDDVNSLIFSVKLTWILVFSSCIHSDRYISSCSVLLFYQTSTSVVSIYIWWCSFYGLIKPLQTPTTLTLPGPKEVANTTKIYKTGTRWSAAQTEILQNPTGGQARLETLKTPDSKIETWPVQTNKLELPWQKGSSGAKEASVEDDVAKH